MDGELRVIQAKMGQFEKRKITRFRTEALAVGLKRVDISEVEPDDLWDVGAEEGQKTKILAGCLGTGAR